MEGMSDKEYQNCIATLGLLDGEKTMLQVVCRRYHESPPSVWRKKEQVTKESHKGFLVLTNDNMIFMQQQGAWSSNYAQGLRIPLEHVTGVVSGGTVMKHIRVTVEQTGSDQHEFIRFEGRGVDGVRTDIERVLNEARQEKKKLAQAALASGTVPQMIFCKFCGARNRSDQTKCSNCGALL
jgi:ribosomal protein L40E